MGPKRSEEFKGWSLPDGTFLPPEFEYILPQLKPGSALRVMLVILIEYVRPGRDAEPLTFDTIQERSGLKSRQSIVNALRYLMDAGAVTRMKVGRTFLYEPVLRNSLKNRLQRMHESFHDHVVDSSSSDSDVMIDMHARENVAKVLCERCFLSEWVAQDLAMRYEPDRIMRQVEYAEFMAAHKRLRRSISAYVVAGIKGHADGSEYNAPGGYTEDWRKGGGGSKGKKRWFTDDEFETFFEKPEGVEGDE